MALSAANYVLLICIYHYSYIVIGIGGGDYPHLNPACYHDYPHAILGQCNENSSPILQFGTVYRHAEMLPNMIAMPNPSHLQCFLEWGVKKTRCGSFDLGRDSESKFEVSGRGDCDLLSSLCCI